MSVIDLEVDLGEKGLNHLVPRIFSESQGVRALPAHLKSYGPLWEPPSFVHPVYRRRWGWQIQREPFGLNTITRAHLQTAEADLLYGPAMDVVCDLGWYKGKWDMLHKTENSRWGGWFDDLILDLDELSVAQLDANRVRPYLPHQLKTPLPIKPKSSSNSSIFSVIPSTAPSLLQIRDSEEDGQGTLDCYAGPLKVGGIVDGQEQITQKKFRFQMFAGCPLKQLQPGKEGYIFNAGGPVWSIDFLPGVDCCKPQAETSIKTGGSPRDTKPHLDYLALSTISEDPGLIPPSEMRKRSLAAKGSVQIWSVPAVEPAILGRPATPGRWSQEPMMDVLLPPESAVHADAVPSEAEPNPRLRILLALSSQATVVRWCPRGGAKEGDRKAGLSCLGILAIAMMDGSVGLYAPPDPTLASLNPLGPAGEAYRDVLSFDLKPRAELQLPDTTCLTLDWANHDVIAGGCTNGHIVIWHVLDVLESITSMSSFTPFTLVQVRPTHYIPLHAAPIRSLVWIRTPPISQNGEAQTDQDPTFLASTGYDGSLKLIDTDDIASSATLIHERGETTSLAFSSALGSLHLADSDYSIKAICMKPRDLGVSKKVLIQLGLLWQLATSDLHSFIAYAAADGVCGLASLIRPPKYKSRATMWAPKVYQMDFSRNSGELRMLDNLQPDPRSNDGTAVLDDPLEAKSRKKKAKKASEDHDGDPPPRKGTKFRTEHPAQSNSPVGVWPAIVAVHCVSWCPSMRRASVLASGMGCGLVRVDAVGGGWHGKGMRFGGIDGLLDGANDPQAADKDDDEDMGD